MPETNPVAKPALPDRLSIDPKSPHFAGDVLQFQIGIRFNGAEKTNVEEYCVSESGVRMQRAANPRTASAIR